MADGVWSLMDLNISQSYNVARLVHTFILNHIYYVFTLKTLCSNNVCSWWKDHFAAICVLIYMLCILNTPSLFTRFSINDIFKSRVRKTTRRSVVYIRNLPRVASSIIHMRCTQVHRWSFFAIMLSAKCRNLHNLFLPCVQPTGKEKKETAISNKEVL
jgi:predicted ferric reductase